MRGLFLCGVLTLLACLGRGEASAQDTAAEEARLRATVIAQLPPDAAKVLFGRESTPAAGPPQAIGSYERGCLSGAIALPADGPNWQVMRPSRNRAWGHPVLIAFLERLAQKLPGEAGWPGLLVGDISQPRGGPMLTGHGSHQIGLDVDIWLTPMPNRRLSPAERDGISATDVVAGEGWISTRRSGRRSIAFCSRPSPESPWWSAFLSTRQSSARCAARAGRSGPGWPRFGRGGGTITISMSGFPARAAALNVVGKHRRRQATAAARSSIGGSPKRRVTRDPHHPENRCGLATCRRLVPRSSLRRPDKGCSFGAQRNETVRPDEVSFAGSPARHC